MQGLRTARPDDGYSMVDLYPETGDVPDWAKGTWYQASDGRRYAHREMLDTGVRRMTKLLPRTGSEQANEAVIGLGVAALAVATLSRIAV